MKRRIGALTVIAAAWFGAMTSTCVFAQVAQPGASPTPDPLVYNDRAVHLRVPSGFHLAGSRSISVADLSPSPSVAAVWVRLKPSPQKILLAFAADSDRVDGWTTTYTDLLRSQESGLLVKREAITLKNGMPAFFLTLTFGSGLQQQREYSVVWSDGQRGAVFTLTAPDGNVDATQAKVMLTDVRAVLYPSNQP